MTRLEATKALTEWFGSNPVIASLGHPAYDLFATGDRDTYFYTWGSMGLASSIGVGLAMAQPDRRVVVLDGDGSLLMNLGSLATIGWVRPKNLVLIVWDNALYGTTGGQDTATAHGADLAAAARAMSIFSVVTVTTIDELRTAANRADAQSGPHVIVAKVTENAPGAKPTLDYVQIKTRFMSALGVQG
ncbi:MAG TPA: thiamine pyrophosphate-dependent enzyme [Vicinamibacterales bacterium]|nr:thiamine pyrophosphate-dependent enzyme [Vicinamibacterales bacterium]